MICYKEISYKFDSSRAAEANQERIVRLIFKIKPDYNLCTICDQRGRNVFHYAVKNLDVLYLLLWNIRVRISLSLNSIPENWIHKVPAVKKESQTY